MSSSHTPEQLALLPHNNAGPKLLASVWILWALATVFFFLRVFCKFTSQRRLWWDDYVLAAAWLLLLVSCSIVTQLVRLGFGKHTYDYPPENFRLTILLIAVRTSFAITAIAWSKTSFAITLLRLTEGQVKKLVWFIAISTNIALGVAALIPWLQCKPIAAFWDISVHGKCWSPKIVYYIYIVPGGAYSAAMDFVLALLPWKIVWHLQMRPKEKIGIAVAMSMGVFAGVTAVVKTAMLPNLFSGDLYNGVKLVIWDVAESAVTITAASIPALRILLRDARLSREASYPLEDKPISVPKTPRNWKDLSILQEPSSTSSKDVVIEELHSFSGHCELVSKSAKD